MKYGKEDLSYLKIQLLRDIIGIIGMIVLFFIGVGKNIMPIVWVSVLIGGFIIFQAVKTIIIIYKIENSEE